MSKGKRKPSCDWCTKPARYEHPHVVGRPQMACEKHHQGCTRCLPIGGDKYWQKAADARRTGQ